MEGGGHWNGCRRVRFGHEQRGSVAAFADAAREEEGVGGSLSEESPQHWAARGYVPRDGGTRASGDSGVGEGRSREIGLDKQLAGCCNCLARRALPGLEPSNPRRCCLDMRGMLGPGDKKLLFGRNIP